MKALLKKDILVLWRSMPVVLALVLVFAVMQALAPDSTLLGFALLYAGMLPMTVRSYDESCHWDRLAVMLPYRTFQLVFCKFLLGYLGLLGVTGVAMLSRAVVTLARGASGAGSIALPLFLFLCMAAMMQSVCLTAVFRFGMQKGRYVYYAGFALTFAAVTALRQSAAQLTPGRSALTVLTLTLLAVSIAVCVAGVALSCRFYRRGLEKLG